MISHAITVGSRWEMGVSGQRIATERAAGIEHEAAARVMGGDGGGSVVGVVVGAM